MAVIKFLLLVTYAEIGLPIIALFATLIVSIVICIPCLLILYRKPRWLFIISLTIPIIVYSWGVWSLLLHDLIALLDLSQWWLKILLMIGMIISVRIIQRSQPEKDYDHVESMMSNQLPGWPTVLGSYISGLFGLFSRGAVFVFLAQWIVPNIVLAIYPDWLHETIASINYWVVSLI